MLLAVLLVVRFSDAYLPELPINQATTQIVQRNSRSFTRSPEEDAGLFEGDIRLPHNFNPKLRKAIFGKTLLWKNGVVPYKISDRIDVERRELILSAMRTIENATQVDGRQCIRFSQRTSETDFITLEDLRNCWSEIGRLGRGEQVVSLGLQCSTIGIIMHELLHTLGFFHEQSRADRDDYVIIYHDNIRKGDENNFQKYALGTMIQHLNQPYDYGSIMHYPENIFAIDASKPTITPKREGVIIGQRSHLSPIDVEMIQLLYGCKNNSVLSYACEDILPDCSLYDRKYCEGEYVPWASLNCPKYCGLGNCTPIEKEKCKDALADCADYNLTTCSTHRLWAEENCAAFCGFCAQDPSGLSVLTAPVTIDTAAHESRDHTEVTALKVHSLFNTARPFTHSPPIISAQRQTLSSITAATRPTQTTRRVMTVPNTTQRPTTTRPTQTTLRVMTVPNTTQRPTATRPTQTTRHMMTVPNTTQRPTTRPTQTTLRVMTVPNTTQRPTTRPTQTTRRVMIIPYTNQRPTATKPTQTTRRMMTVPNTTQRTTTRPTQTTRRVMTVPNTTQRTTTRPTQTTRRVMLIPNTTQRPTTRPTQATHRSITTPSVSRHLTTKKLPTAATRLITTINRITTRPTTTMRHTTARGVAAATGPNKAAPSVCQDRKVNCPAYGPSVCSNFLYWAEENCTKYCGWC